MKRIFLTAIVAASLASCHVNDTNDMPDEHSTSTTETVITDSGTVKQTTTVTYTAGEGDVMLKDGKVMVWKNGAWTEASGDVTMDGGMIITRSGEVKKEGKMVKLEDGEAVSKTGNFFDRAGVAISDGWDATKKGVSKAADAAGKGLTTAAEKSGEALEDAGQAIGKGAEKVGEKTKEIVNGKKD